MRYCSRWTHCTTPQDLQYNMTQTIRNIPCKFWPAHKPSGTVTQIVQQYCLSSNRSNDRDKSSNIVWASLLNSVKRPATPAASKHYNSKQTLQQAQELKLLHCSKFSTLACYRQIQARNKNCTNPSKEYNWTVTVPDAQTGRNWINTRIQCNAQTTAVRITDLLLLLLKL